MPVFVLLLCGGGLALAGEAQQRQQRQEQVVAKEKPPAATLTVVKFREPDEAEVTLEIANTSGKKLYLLRKSADQPVYDLEWIKDGQWVAHLARSCRPGLEYRLIAPGGTMEVKAPALKYEEFRYCLFLCYQRDSGEWRQKALRTRSIKLEEAPHLAQSEWSTGLVMLHPPEPEDAPTEDYPSEKDPRDPFSPDAPIVED
jgi:hypothetical protein